MEEIKAREITQNQLIRSLVASKKPNSDIRFGFLLGAGASISSGIKSGGTLAAKWMKEIEEDLDKNEFDAWKAQIGYSDDKNIAEFYTKIYPKRFEANPQEGFELLQEYMENAKPSVGYAFLAQVLAQTRNRIVITTNFDTMTEDALFGFTKTRPLVLGHELLGNYLKSSAPARPTIIKVHRDMMFEPYNREDETEKLARNWQKSLEPILAVHSLIVIGYGGNDDSLMNYLEMIKKRKPIYWCYLPQYGIPSKAKKLLKEDDFIVPIKGFDEFMLLVNDKMGFGQMVDPDDIANSRVVHEAIEYAKLHQEQLEKLTKEGLDPESQTAIRKLLPSWWDYQLAANAEENIDEKDRIYQDGMKAHPMSFELMGNYANFLYINIEDYDKAEKYYLNALEANPDYITNIRNYAVFLQKATKDYKKSEEYYLKALEINPYDVNNNSYYAMFLYNIRKDYEKAEKYYLKALAIDPNHANTNNAYALFLQNIRKKYDKAEKHYLKALEVNPEDSDYNGAYALFLQNIRKNYDKAEEYYLKAIRIDPKNVTITGAYALFLYKIRKDYDKAEEYYLKALEADPNHANNNGNYAQLLLIQNRRDEAERYIETAFKNMNEENDLSVELWFYRLAHFPKYFEVAQQELDRLLAQGVRSIGWDFSGNIERVRQDGLEDIALLEEYARRISEPDKI